jgi:two-component system, CAI-1 autoinducer sensor kinase/phosphatase CqsS
MESMQQALPPPTASLHDQMLHGRQVDALYRHVAESELAVKRGLQVIAMTLDEVSAKPLDASVFCHLSAAEATHKAVQEYAFETDAERARVSVEVIEDFTFHGDETAYLFVLFNLIKNAVYYLTLFPDARIAITVGRQEVHVRDTGPGIPPEAIAGLFQPFSSSGKSGGTGLGLAYCRRVMRGFGGDIGCESVLGKYTQFTLRFPPVDGEERLAHRAAVLETSRAAFAGKRLLIVDDDAAQRTATRLKLEPLGAQIDEAGDGGAALQALARDRYDLIVLDLNMPVLDGYAVAEKIRQGAVPANREVRIVAHTGEPGYLASVKTRRAGIDGFVNKPCEQLTLAQALLHALERPVAQAVPEIALAGRRVLLADDNPYNRKAVAAYLKHAGVMVVEADHGQAVLDHLQTPCRWDAVLMDLNMPGMNGLETARAIRASGTSWSRVPIVALTAHSGREMLEAAQSAGMDDFVTKPVDAGVLHAKLCQLVIGAAGVGVGSEMPQAAPAADRQSALLDSQRLESFRRIGMLQELLNDYLPEIERLVDKLEVGAATVDLQASLDALHSLLGMSGEAGAQVLYRLVRGFYVPMVETHAWPLDATWIAQIKTAAAAAAEALRAYAPAQALATP